MEYHELRDTLNTGDIVLFEGDDILSATIELGSRSAWSHIGMIVKLGNLRATLLWESFALPHGIIGLEGNTTGVMSASFEDRLKVMKHTKRVAVRKLNKPLSAAQETILESAREEFKHKHYETNILELVGAAFDFTGFNNTPDLSTIFCSEMVAEVYQRLGLLDLSIPSDEYVPGDFVNPKLALLQGFELGELISVTLS